MMISCWPLLPPRNFFESMVQQPAKAGKLYLGWMATLLQCTVYISRVFVFWGFLTLQKLSLGTIQDGFRSFCCRYFRTKTPSSDLFSQQQRFNKLLGFLLEVWPWVQLQSTAFWTHVAAQDHDFQLECRKGIACGLLQIPGVSGKPKVKAAIEDLKADQNFISVDEDFLELLVQFLGGWSWEDGGTGFQPSPPKSRRVDGMNSNQQYGWRFP